MHGVRVAKQVVQVAEDLLVGADQEDAEVIVLTVGLTVQLEHRLDVAQVDERIDLAVGIARHVAEDRIVRGPLAEPMDRHHRKELIDRPGVWSRLEDRQIDVVDRGHDLF